MAGLIGKKIGMTSMYNDDGKNLPCTIIELGPCVVTQVRTIEKDGYEAVQIGYGDKKEKHTSSALAGHFKKAKTAPKSKLAEFTGYETELGLGDEVNVDIFIEGEYVDVIGTAKGKGFQGVVKRHGFGGVGQRSHGQHNRERAPGSIGAASFPARVFKGMKMAGRTGGKRVKTLNLQVLKVIPEKNILIVLGAVPGPQGGFVTVKK